MTVTITANQVLAALPLLLPVFVAFFAGLLRQDRLSDSANEAITVVLILAAAIANAAFNNRLTHNAELDFVVVAGYAAALIQLPQLQSLQKYLQSNVLNFFKTVAELPTPPTIPSAQVVALPTPQVEDPQATTRIAAIKKTTIGG